MMRWHRYEVGFWDPANVWRVEHRIRTEQTALATVEAHARVGNLMMEVRPAAHLRTSPEPPPRRLPTIDEVMASEDD